MMRRIDVDEAKIHFLEILEAVKRGDTIIIQENDTPVVRLMPVTQLARRPQFGSGRGRIRMADDFDAPLADFDDYVK